ncbi:unnamed protein product [Dicrocoelium dendriticum]|nr:unnamed protein product [Dicrocoelium dendriticum]
MSSYANNTSEHNELPFSGVNDLFALLTHFSYPMSHNRASTRWYEANDSSFPLLNAIISIPWMKEPWLFALVSFHTSILIGGICGRKHPTFLATLLFAVLSGCVCSAWLNELGAKYWRYFATEQYFDSHGLFLLLSWSLPTVLNAIVLTILLLIQVGHLLVQKKRLDLKMCPQKLKTN